MRSAIKLGYIIVLIFASLILPSNSHAQESNINSGQLEEYVPPPLFGDRILPAPTDKGRLGLPTISKEIVIKETPLLTTPANPPASVKPIPKIKPKNNFAKIKARTTPSKGIVKGPKVMPAVKKQNVETEVLFEAKVPTIDLTNTVKPEETIVKTIKREKPAEISTEKSWILEFTNTNDGNITKEHEAVLLGKIIPQLDFNVQSRVFIESFATAPDKTTSLSADRRIALSRALAVRSYLIEQEIAVSRIDLRALGEKDSQESGKRALNQVNIQILE